MRQLRLTKDISAVSYTVVGAFFLALIVGLVAKNPFATVLVRAFVSALLFGALVYAGVWMLKRYIPELVMSNARRKNIEAGAGEKENPVPLTEFDEKNSEQDLPVQFKSEDEHASAGDTEGGLEAGAFSGMTEEKGEGNLAGEDDSLPSLDGLFSDEVKPLPDYQSEAAPPPSRKKGENIAIGNFRIPFEPETLAKAIKKVMSQDEGR